MGYTVLLGCRSEARGAEAERKLRAEGLAATAIALDVGVPLSLSTAAVWVDERFQRLDVLVNNAAIHYDSWQRVSDPEWTVVAEAFEINTLGAWRTSLAFLALLKRSPHGRIVNVSSEAGSLSSMGAGTPAYSISKAALNAVTCMFASDLKSSGILVNSICPGWTATDMGGSRGRPIEAGARGIVWGATLPDGGPSGGFFRDGKPLRW
jgi:NAD(P)-dependent dehydrogenase (short-subunit alcohol dehydrogenase family)